jgi:hypothetical protein
MRRLLLPAGSFGTCSSRCECHDTRRGNGSTLKSLSISMAILPGLLAFAVRKEALVERKLDVWYDANCRC